MYPRAKILGRIRPVYHPEPAIPIDAFYHHEASIRRSDSSAQAASRAATPGEAGEFQIKRLEATSRGFHFGLTAEGAGGSGSGQAGTLQGRVRACNSRRP